MKEDDAGGTNGVRWKQHVLCKFFMSAAGLAPAEIQQIGLHVVT